LLIACQKSGTHDIKEMKKIVGIICELMAVTYGDCLQMLDGSPGSAVGMPGFSPDTGLLQKASGGTVLALSLVRR
jgi:hypothetical protein